MKSNLEQLSTLERKLNIQVPVTEVQAAFEKAYKGIQRYATIKGFRKGKAPLSTVRTLFGDRVKQDVVQDLVQKHYATALNEHSLEPISYPAIEFDEINAQADFSFTAEFEVRPEVKLLQIDNLPVQRETLEVPTDFVDKTLQEIRQNRAESVPVLEDRPAQNGDVAVIDFEGFLLTGPLENGAGKDHELELGGNQFIPGFEEQIVGMTVGGNRDIQLTFPENYHAAEIAGKPVTFKTVLKALKKKVLPELNDEFAKGAGPYETLEQLKAAVREDFEKREGKRIQDEMRSRLMTVLVDRNPVHVPKALLNDQKKALVADFKQRIAQKGMDETYYEQNKDQWETDFEQTASFMIQSSFLVDTLAKENDLRATESDYNEKLKEYAAQTGIDLKRLKEFYADDDKKSRMMYQITEDKVVEFLLSKAQIKDVSRDELATEVREKSAQQ